ncbi:MAG TPA: single-stranded DNA-binding protein, partial [Bacillota bacterium]|nr:single-stranded DNA-binding protein [Bacillota bacterium]
IQSRNYQKKVSEEEFITRTAYEVSISKMELCDAEVDIDCENEEQRE